MIIWASVSLPKNYLNALYWSYGPFFAVIFPVRFIDAIDVPMSPLDSAFINISSAICLRNIKDWKHYYVDSLFYADTH